MKVNKNKIITILTLAISLVLIGILFIDLMPLLKQIIQNSNDKSQTIKYIESYGAKGIPILIGLQFLQVLIPFFPSAPIQILAGLCYGIWIGSLLCLIGFIAGHSLIFYTMRNLGNTIAPYFENKFFSKKNNLQNKLSAKNIKKPEKMVFILYLIPLFPNGMLPFLFAKTNISYKKYLINMACATIPSTLIYTLLGDRLGSGDYKIVIAIACVALVLLLIVAIFKNKIMNILYKSKEDPIA